MSGKAAVLAAVGDVALAALLAGDSVQEEVRARVVTGLSTEPGSFSEVGGGRTCSNGLLGAGGAVVREVATVVVACV